MAIYIFTDKTAQVQKAFPKKVKVQSIKGLSKFTPDKDDKVFVDVSGFDGVKINELLAQAKENTSSSGSGGVAFLNDNIKLPQGSGRGGVFPGWNKIKSGAPLPCYLLYCSFEGKTPLESRFSGKHILEIHKQFIDLLEYNFYDCDALLWMNSGRDCLFLIPPKQKCIEKAVTACINMLISAPLNSMEYLNLSFPVSFIFALHYGSINYKPPGKTGTVVNDAVNFIFHLGTKKAELGRLTLSGDLPGVSVPNELQDIFISVKDFEGRKVFHSKKFEYPKTWI